MTQNEILNTIASNNHSLFTPEFVDEVNKAFKTDITTWEYQANPHDPKGLTLPNGAKSAEGLSAFDLAELLCGELGVEYTPALGRGTTVQRCIEALRSAGYGQE